MCEGVYHGRSSNNDIIAQPPCTAPALIYTIGVIHAEKQQAAASVEADKASVASAEAAAIEKDAEKELTQAEPAMRAAAEAVNCLSKSMLTELKSLPKPPAGVDKASNRCI